MFARPSKSNVAACLLIILIALDHVRAEENLDPEKIRAARELGAGVVSMELYRAIDTIWKEFDVPLNREPHPEYARALDGEGTLRLVDVFPVRQGETLASVLDRLTAKPTRLRWEVLHGQICILPEKETPDEILSGLDVRVSVDLENVSLWEAFKEVVKQVNESGKLKYRLIVQPYEYGVVRKPVPELTGVRDVTIRLNNVTARTAVCRIMSEASLISSYWYAPTATERLEVPDILMIYTYDEKGRIRRFSLSEDEFMNWDELNWWHREIDEQAREN
jgi:hypothetical protein